MDQQGSTDKLRIPLMEGFSELIKWITVNGHRHPREVKSAEARADKQECKFARTLRLCRERDKQGKLPEDCVRQLNEVCVQYV